MEWGRDGIGCGWDIPFQGSSLMGWWVFVVLAMVLWKHVEWTCLLGGLFVFSP